MGSSSSTLRDNNSNRGIINDFIIRSMMISREKVEKEKIQELGNNIKELKEEKNKSFKDTHFLGSTFAKFFSAGEDFMYVSDD